MRVAVVTDSTCDLPVGITEAMGVRVVPLSVAFGGRDLYSRVTVTDEEFYAELATSDELPTTSQPVGPWFDEAWADAADDGFDAIVSLHVSDALSGTVDRARTLAATAAIPVHVVDSRQVSGGLALQVLAAVRVAEDGGTPAQVVAAADAARRTTTSVIAVDTLEYLRRGGRLSGTQAMVGTALRMRPVLGVQGGRIELIDRARTWSKAVERLVDRVAEQATAEPQHAVIAHAMAPARAQELLEAVSARVEVAQSLQVVIGPVVGTHTGPGAVGVALAPARLTCRPSV
jgi:DegV family protein with EDD domain